MANKDTPRGLECIGDPLRVNAYYVDAAYATALYVGDPVVRVAGGANAAAVEGAEGVHEAGTLARVERASLADNGRATGVIVGIVAVRDSLNRRYKPASTEAVILVADHPYQRFSIQDDGSAALDESAVGLNAVMVGTGGSTASGYSAIELDANADAPAADASNPLRIVCMDNRIGNALGVNANWVVQFSDHTEAHGALGI